MVPLIEELHFSNNKLYKNNDQQTTTFESFNFIEYIEMVCYNWINSTIRILVHMFSLKNFVTNLTWKLSITTACIYHNTLKAKKY